MAMIAGTQYDKVKLTTGDILLIETNGHNKRWFESESHYQLWMRYNRH